MAIELAIGAPISMMNILCPTGDIELCFAHLLNGGNSEYQQYYRRAKEIGRFVILDNGIMEVGFSMNTSELLSVTIEMLPNLVTPPEVLHDSDSTLKLTQEFINVFIKSGAYPKTKIFGVAHGATFIKWRNSFKELLQIPYISRIGLPYDIPFDVFSVTTEIDNMLEVLVTRRVELCEWIAENFPNAQIHLFGLAHPSELVIQKKNSIIKSIDTSLPVMAAANGIKYDVSNFGPYVKKVLDINLPFNKQTVDLAIHNISIVKNYWLK